MIKLIKSSFYQDTEIKRKLADFILETEVFSMDKQCREYEKAFAHKQERKFGVFVANGSLANLVLIQAMLNLGLLKKGDKVAVSALTWPTNVMPLMQLGLRPLLIDCELKNLNVSPEILEPQIEEIKALFLTNVLGFCDRIEEIARICRGRGIILMEDNCEGLGSRVKGRLLGNFGLASTFSTFVGHHLSTIEGGMICTDDERLHEMMVMIRAHGWDRNLSVEQQDKLRKEHNIDAFFAKYTFYDLAYNCRPTEINGFIGNLQLGYWEEIVEKRHGNFKKFNEAITGNSDFLPFDLRHMELISNFAMPVVCKSREIFEKYKKKFEDNEVEIRPVIAGSMANQPFYKKYAEQVDVCNNADFIHKNAFYFANNPELTGDEVDFLCNLLVDG